MTNILSTDIEVNFNYIKLALYIQEMLARSDPTVIENIPTFISLAESRLAIDLKFLGGVQVGQFALIANPNIDITIPQSIIVEKPILWRQTKSFSLLLGTERSYLYPRSYEYFQTYLNDLTNLTLAQRATMDNLIFYSDYDQYNWIIGPIDQTKMYNAEVLYFSEILKLSSTNLNNYWTEYAPRALLYAALYEASFYLRSDERSMTSWKSNYDDAIMNLSKQDKTNFIDNSVQRSH